MGVLGLVTVLVMVLEALGDPGPAALIWVLAWVLVIVLLSWLLLRWPARFARGLAALAAVVVGLWVWFGAAPGAWIDFMDERGPVLPMIALAVALPAAALALRRPTTAGLSLVALGVAPALALVLIALGDTSGDRAVLVLVGGSVLAGAPVCLFAGILFLVAAMMDRRSARAPESA